MKIFSSLGFAWVSFRNCNDEQAKSRNYLSEVYKKNAVELSAYKKEITKQYEGVSKKV